MTHPEQLLKTIKDFMTLFRKTLVEVQVCLHNHLTSMTCYTVSCLPESIWCPCFMIGSWFWGSTLSRCHTVTYCKRISVLLTLPRLTFTAGVACDDKYAGIICLVKFNLTNVIDALLLDYTRVNAVYDSTAACSGHAMILSHQQTLPQNQMQAAIKFA